MASEDEQQIIYDHYENDMADDAKSSEFKSK